MLRQMMTTLEDEMAAARGRWTSRPLQQWYPTTRLHTALRAAMQPEADRVGDLDFGAAFRDNVATIDVPDPAAWANRRVDLGDGHWCVTGIRYRALDVTKPFVDVIATSLPPTAAALTAVADQVLPQYEEFAPRAIRVDAPDPDGLIADVVAHPAFAGAAVDQYIIAGRVEDLRAQPALPGYERVGLNSIGIDEAASTAARCYAQIEHDRPDLRGWAHPADANELQDAHDEGLLFRIEVGGEPAGVIAANRDDDHAMTGFVVQEIVLDPAFLGRRLAAPAQQRLVRRLPAAAGDTLWGSIHPDNQPSLRNAQSLGRKVVGAYLWLTPTGLPGL